MNVERFYELAAKRFAASTVLLHVDSVVHVEAEDDIWFWRQMLAKFRPGKYKFLPATINYRGVSTSGCEQCLKYRKFLSSRFFICIDSDLRRFSNDDISAKQGILQTYTYSWENHCVFSDRLQESFKSHICNKELFDFRIFIKKYSAIVYKPIVMMLSGISGLDKETLWKCLTLQYQKGDEINNGETFLCRLQKNIDGVLRYLPKEESNLSKYKEKGLVEETAYLYVRGHCIYNSIVSIGKKLCRDTDVDFVENVMKESIAYGKYKEINDIENDIRFSLPKV